MSTSPFDLTTKGSDEQDFEAPAEVDYPVDDATYDWMAETAGEALW